MDMELCKLVINTKKNSKVRYCSSLCYLWPLGWMAHPSVARWCTGTCGICFSRSAWVLSRLEIPQSSWTWTQLFIRVTGDSKLPPEVNNNCPDRSRVHACLSLVDCWDSVQHQASLRWKNGRIQKYQWRLTPNVFTFTLWDANSFIYIRVCLHFLALWHHISTERFELMITIAATTLIGCNFLTCAYSHLAKQ